MLFSDIEYCDENFVQQRGYIAVKDGRIASVTKEKPPGDLGELIAGEGRFLIPGLVNAHCHVPMILLRGYGEGLPLDRWLNERVFPFEDKITDEDAYHASLVGIAEMLASGVTSFSDMYDHCCNIAEAVLRSGIKANIARGVVAFGDDGFYGTLRYEESLELIDKWNGKGGGRIITETALHSEYLTNGKAVRELVEFCVSRGLRSYTHLSETKKEHAECVGRHGRTPARYFEATGFFKLPVTVAHCTHITDDDIAVLGKHEISVAHCPTSNLKLGSGVAPLQKLADAGVNVALGTDGASSNNNLNLFEEMHLAALIHRGVGQDPDILPPSDILRMATRGGAIAQGRLDTGLIKEGYRADFAVVDFGRPHLSPSHDHVANTVYAAQASDVEMTIVDGRIVYRDGRFANFDVADAMAKSVAAAARITGELNNFLQC
jgi:5-methylthioadenosine/S-adenosylhomocysteine deaminase